MKLNLFQKPLSVLGLDMGDTRLRAFQLSGTRQSARTVACSEQRLKKNTITNDAILDKDGLIGAIQKLIEEPKFGRFTTKFAVVSLPESKSFVRVIHIPQMSEKEIEGAIPFEAESYIPIPIDQVYLDWQILSSSEGRLEILIMASPKEYVDQLVEIVETAGLVPTAFEVQCQSLVRGVVPDGSHDTFLLADIEASKTDMVLVERGNIQFTSTLPIAGNVFTDSVAKGLGVPFDKAEKIKVDSGVVNTPEYPNLKLLMLPALNNFVTEIKNLLTFHSEHSTEKVAKLLLVGGGGRLPHMTDFLQSELAIGNGFVVQSADPLVNLHLTGTNPFKPTEELSYATVIGLAMRELK